MLAITIMVIYNIVTELVITEGGGQMDITSMALKKIKELREAKGYTMQEVADGINYKTGKGYFDIETGKTKLKLEHLEMLAKFYEVPINIFFEDNVTKTVINKAG